MTKTSTQAAYDDLYDDDDDFLDEPEWEDNIAFQNLRSQCNPGWHLIKINNYDYRKLDDIEAWCAESLEHGWGRVNWSGYCSYSTGIQFEDLVDAALFKMRWV